MANFMVKVWRAWPSCSRLLSWVNRLNHLLCSTLSMLVTESHKELWHAFTHYQFNYSLWSLRCIAWIEKYQLHDQLKGIILLRDRKIWNLCFYNKTPAFKPSGDCALKLPRSKNRIFPSTHAEKEFVRH